VPPAHQVTPVSRPPAAAPAPATVTISAPPEEDGRSADGVATPEITPAFRPPIQPAPPSHDLARGVEESVAPPDRERDLLAELLDTNRRLTADAERRLRREVSEVREVPRPEPRVPPSPDRVESAEVAAPPAGEPPRASAASLLELHERLTRDARARLRRDQDGG